MNDSGFRIVDSILKGDEVPYQNDYTSLGEFILDTLDVNPDFVGEVTISDRINNQYAVTICGDYLVGASQVDTITGEEYTYDKMRDRSVRCAWWMKLQGLVAGDVVTICSNNHLDVAMPCFAALYLGVVVSPLDIGMNRREFHHLLSITEPKVAFVGKEIATVIADAAADAQLDLKIIVFGQTPDFLDFESVIAQPTASEVTNFKRTPIGDPDANAFIVCTSGTTGSPKGVAMGHAAFLKQMNFSKQLVERRNICVVFTSLAWVTGIFNIFMSLASDIPRLIVPPFEEYSACELIERYKVNWVFMAPNMINRIIKSDATNKYNISSLERVICGGSSLSYTSRQAFAKIVPNVEIITGYGMTEVGGVLSKQITTSNPESCGRIVENCQLKVVDPDTGRIMGPNQNGELLLKNSLMMNCYYRNPEATAQAVDEKGWFHSGDLGYFDENGDIFIVGRLKELIKYRGYHISPSVIESLILSHPGVGDVAVIGLPHPQDDEHPLAFVVKNADPVTTNKGVTEEELMRLVAAEMSDSKRLRGGVKFIENIPRTPSGKIQRRKLRDLAMSTIAV